MTAHLHWLIPGKYNSISDLENSNLASVRMRAAIAVQSILGIGNKVTVTFGDIIPQQTSLLIIGKIGGDCSQVGRDLLWLQQLEKLNKSCVIALDYTDNHLEFETVMGHFYRKALRFIKIIITSSDYLALKVHSTNKEIYTIDDPIEIEITTARPHCSTPPRILWFGHSTNAVYLVDFINDNLCEFENLEMDILSNEPGLTLISKSVRNPKVNLNLIKWSLESMVRYANQCDICVIPSNLTDPRKLGVSSNRLITSFALGIPTAADLLPSYCMYSSFFVDLRSNEFREMLSNPNIFLDKALTARKLVAPSFTSLAIQKKWQSLLNEILRNRSIIT